MRGVMAEESLNDGSMAKGMGSTNLLPIDSATKLVTAGTSCVHTTNISDEA